MTKEEAVKYWGNLWKKKIESDGFNNRDDDFWYVNGYVCAIQGRVHIGHAQAIKPQFRDVWTEGYLDSKNDWP